MKKRYVILLLALVLLIILIMVITIVSSYKVQNQEKDEQQKTATQELKEKKQELIKLCEENQEEFEAISEEMLEILETDGKMKEDVTWEVAAHIGKQVKNPEWEKLSKDLVAYYPFDEGTPEGKIYYQYWSRNPYTLKILYIKADEEEAIDYLASRFDSDKFFTKINEHLYVCVENEPGV